MEIALPKGPQETLVSSERMLNTHPIAVQTLVVWFDSCTLRNRSCCVCVWDAYVIVQSI